MFYLLGTDSYRHQKSCSPSSLPSNLSPPHITSQPSCFQFSSCALKPPALQPYYHPSTLLPYNTDWTHRHRQQFNQTRFPQMYESAKPQLTSFLPPSPKDYQKSDAYPQQLQESSLSEWYVCQNAAPTVNGEHNDSAQRHNPNGSLIHNQSALTAGF